MAQVCTPPVSDDSSGVLVLGHFFFPMARRGLCFFSFVFYPFHFSPPLPLPHRNLPPYVAPSHLMRRPVSFLSGFSLSPGFVCHTAAFWSLRLSSSSGAPPSFCPSPPFTPWTANPGRLPPRSFRRLHGLYAACPQRTSRPLTAPFFPALSAPSRFFSGPPLKLVFLFSFFLLISTLCNWPSPFPI